MQPEKNGMAVASMVLGIAGLVLFCVGIGIIPAIVALILGILVIIRKESGRGMAIAGIATATIGITLAIVVLIIATANSRTEESVKKGTIESGMTSGVGQSETPKSEELDTHEDKTSESEETSGDNAFHVGEILESKDEKLTYLSCDTDYIPDSRFAHSKSGNKIVRLEFEYENIGKVDSSISFYSFTGYADGYKVDPWYYADDDISGTISTGKKIKGSVYFEVPENAKEITVEYDMSFWSSKKAVFVVE